MKNRRNIILLIAVLGVAVVIAGSFSTYFIRDDSGGEALWNSDEAYFFVHVATRGLHVTWLGYPWFLIKNLIGGFAAAVPPDDERSSVIVVHVTASAAERHLLSLKDPDPGGAPTMYTPREGRIYANCPALHGLCVWAGDHFEQSALEGRVGIDGISLLTMKDFESNNGWSKRGFGVTGTDFAVAVGDKFKLSVTGLDADNTGHGAISIDRLTPGRAPTKIANIELRNAGVSRNEYWRVFRGSE
jgi:hypothetical protein